MGKSDNNFSKSPSIDDLWKKNKDARMDFRVPSRVKEILRKKANACNVSMEYYTITCALDNNRGGSSKLQNYALITEIQKILNYINERYNTDHEDEELIEMENALWEKLL